MNTEIEKMNEYWNEAIITFNHATQRQAQNEANIEVHNTSWDFKRKNNIIVSIAQIHMYKGNYSDATTILKDLVSEDMSKDNNREFARWYLASLYLQGKEDQNLLKKLLEVNQNEERKIQDIVDSFDRY